jgi:two-component system copper resistance phosphate regulon response regulator CusR
VCDVRILLAEDDRHLRESIARGLREASYAVDDAPDGARALFLAAVNDYDAIILDIVLPVKDGLEVCRGIRRKGNHVPILMLTARDTVDDKIIGLDAGADDYLTKPFDFGELLARLRALVRRRGDVLPAELSVADLVVDTRRHTARRGHRDITLTTKEYALLEHLVRNAGRIVTRAEINAHVWDDNHDPFSNLIDVYVSRLRRKVDGGERVALISTRRGVGYMLAAPAAGNASAAAPRGAGA